MSRQREPLAPLQARHNTNENSRILRATEVNPDGTLIQHRDPVLTPNSNRGMNGRTQYAVNKNNTLYTNFNYQKQEQRNQGLGDFSLISRAADSHNSNSELQIRETSILNAKTVHEVRFQYSHDKRQQSPKTIGVAINVLDTFNGGGGPVAIPEASTASLLALAALGWRRLRRKNA